MAEEKGLTFETVEAPIINDDDEEDEPAEKVQEVKAAPNPPKNKSEEKPDNLSVEPTAALNGAQIQAALSVIEQITSGAMPAEAGKELLISLGLDEPTVMKMLAAIKGFAPKKVETEFKPANIPADE